jgi:hypothetical protein
MKTDKDKRFAWKDLRVMEKAARSAGSCPVGPPSVKFFAQTRIDLWECMVWMGKKS